MAKAIALLSGGLDSRLAILVLLRQGIDITAITFLTNFGCDISDTSSCSSDPFPLAEKFGFGVKLCHLADKFLDIVKNPKYGHGKNMNPCVDCRILMLREAKAFMEMSGADFIVTGEVLGQRPMSQRKDTFPVIDREAGVKDFVLRPLSAKRLKPTIAELNGLVDREKLYGFTGRSRKPQIALAKELGLTEYPPPAGGCLLTDPIYSFRLKELLEHNPDPDLNEINLLRVGRHFRPSENTRIIIGRNERENIVIESISGPDDLLFLVDNYGSPLGLIKGPSDEEMIKIAASITARYSDAKRLNEVEVTIMEGMGNTVRKINVSPAANGLLDRYRIEKRPEKGVTA